MPLKRVTFSGRFAVPKTSENRDVDWKRVALRAVILMALDITIALVVSIVLFYAFQGYIMRAIERPFKCDDPTIRKPFFENTVSTKHLLVISLGVPFFIILIAEAIVFKESRGEHLFPKYLSSSTLVYLEYTLTFTLCTFAMEVIKCLTGRLRPHFIAACDPDWEKVDCKTDPGAWIENAHCKATPRRERVSRTSFPSGHTAAACLFLLFLFIYFRQLTRATSSARLRVFQWLVLFVATVWTIFVAVTRITDNWHHPTDVLGGVILAVVCLFHSWRQRTRDDVFQRRDIQPKEHSE